MRLKTAIFEFCDPLILQHVDGKKALEEYLKKMPGRILDVDLDTTKTSKLGFKDGETLYKMGHNKEKDTIFIEYYEDANLGQPTMMLVVDRNDKRLILKGRQVNRTFFMGFMVVNGVVEKITKVE